MSQHDFDFFVIGAGSGGVRAARMAASFGARVAVAEERYYGGTCVNVGCIPKKLFVYGSRFPEDRAVAAGYGWTVDEPTFDWPTLVRNKDTEIQRLNGIYERMLKNAGCEVIPARATLIDPHTVEVNTPELWLGKRSRPPPSFTRTRRYSFRRSGFFQTKSERIGYDLGGATFAPCKARMKGRTNNKKVTKLDTGLPGKPTKKAFAESFSRRTSPNASGLPGLIAICQRLRRPSASTAGLM